MSKKIIDTHVHIYPEAISERARVALGKFYDFDVPGKGTFDGYIRNATENDISGFLIFSVATTAHQVVKINNFISENVVLARELGFEAYGFASMHQDFEDVEAEIDRCEKSGLQGVKVHPDIQELDLLDKRMYHICEVLEGRMPLCLHMGDDREQYRFSEPKKLAQILKDFPKLKVIAAHFGGYKAWDEASKYIYGHENVWYDNSSALWAMSPERAKELTYACGTQRVMFGTDYPVMKIEQYLELFDKIGLDDDVREDVLYNNAKRFLTL